MLNRIFFFVPKFLLLRQRISGKQFPSRTDKTQQQKTRRHTLTKIFRTVQEKNSGYRAEVKEIQGSDLIYYLPRKLTNGKIFFLCGFGSM